MNTKLALQRFLANVSIGSLAKKKYSVSKEQLEVSDPDPNDWRVKYALKAIMEEGNLSWPIMAIHNIQVETKAKVIEVTIILGRPGLLIGKHGTTINSVINQLESRLEARVTMSIIEFDIWK